MAKNKGKKKVEENGQEILEKEELSTSDEGAKASNEGQEEKSEVDQLKEELEEQKDKYIRLYSEFDNFRRRTSKERLELIKTANEDLIVALLPVIDDFDRAIKAAGEQGSDGKETEKEGVELIYNKVLKVLEGKGVKPMEVGAGDDFDEDIHEAITQIPAPSNDLKGKIVDVVERGYTLNDKVIRFAKVVTGA